jgi:hypothetical protein
VSLRLYMDHHVPSAITRGLRHRGIDVLTAEEDQTAQWDDERLLRQATELGRVALGCERKPYAPKFSAIRFRSYSNQP